MLMTILAAGAAAPAGANPYGLIPALREGGLISQVTFGILVIMSIVSFYILFTKLFEQQKIMNQAKRVRQRFWRQDARRAGNSSGRPCRSGWPPCHSTKKTLTVS